MKVIEEKNIGADNNVISFNDRLDVLRHVSDIKLRLNNDITNDFVLAKLGDKDREGIIEMTGNAYFSKKLIDLMVERSKEWKYDKETETWEHVKLNKEERDILKKIGQSIFDSYMVKIYMTVVLNRNVDKNYLINVLSGYDNKEEGTPMNTNEELMAQLVRDRDKENQIKQEK